MADNSPEACPWCGSPITYWSQDPERHADPRICLGCQNDDCGVRPQTPLFDTMEECDEAWRTIRPLRREDVQTWKAAATIDERARIVAGIRTRAKGIDIGVSGAEAAAWRALIEASDMIEASMGPFADEAPPVSPAGEEER